MDCDLLVCHGRAQIRHSPDFPGDRTVGEGRDGQRQKKNEDEHIQFVDAPVERIFPISDAPIGRKSLTDWQMDLMG